MISYLFNILVCLIICFQIAAAGELEKNTSPLPKGERIVALATNEDSDKDYAKAMEQAKRLGTMAVSLPIPWDELEKHPGKYGMTPNFLAIANTYYPPINIKIAIELNPIDTNNKRIPADLRDKPYDHPEVIERYKRALDYLFSQIPNLELVSLSIGNEIDGLLQNEKEWAQYINFFDQTSIYARSKYQDLKVSSKGMFYGQTKNYQEAFSKLNKYADVVMTTYYPLNSDFSVRDPKVVFHDFSLITELYPNKPIYFMEIGYPSGKINSSSEEKQALFIRNTFKAWDKHAQHIELLEFTWLHDQPKSSIDRYEAYYGSSDPRFLSFLSTLGLRTHHGEDKQAFKELVHQANIRGWK